MRGKSSTEATSRGLERHKSGAWVNQKLTKPPTILLPVMKHQYIGVGKGLSETIFNPVAKAGEKKTQQRKKMKTSIPINQDTPLSLPPIPYPPYTHQKHPQAIRNNPSFSSFDEPQPISKLKITPRKATPDARGSAQLTRNVLRYPPIGGWVSSWMLLRWLKRMTF